MKNQGVELRPLKPAPGSKELDVELAPLKHRPGQPAAGRVVDSANGRTRRNRLPDSIYQEDDDTPVCCCPLKVMLVGGILALWLLLMFNKRSRDE